MGNKISNNATEIMASGMTLPGNPSHNLVEGHNFSSVATMPQSGDVARAIRKVISRPSRLRDMAAELEAEADYLRRRADDIDQDRIDEERLARRKRLIRNAAMAVATGADLEVEAGKVSLALQGEHNASANDMARIIEWQCRNARTVIIARRDREIMLLARHGWTNAEIAGQLPRLGFKTVHPKSISRIIQQRLRGNR